MDHRHRRRGRRRCRNLGSRRAAAVDSDGKSAGLSVPFRIGDRCPYLFRRFPLMLLFIIFCPITGAILIMAGAPARKTALIAAMLTLATALFLLGSLPVWRGNFHQGVSIRISREWHWGFPAGLDALSMVMVLLATIVTLAAVWFTGKI